MEPRTTLVLTTRGTVAGFTLEGRSRIFGDEVLRQRFQPPTLRI